jgi:hypothetical protein
MTLSIGRFGHPTYGGVPQALVDVDELTQSGDTITIKGVFYAPTTIEAAAMRAQLLGYVNNPDEPVVPVISSADLDLTGFWTVQYATVDTGIISLVEPVWPFTVQMTRALNSSQPLFESTLANVAVPNSGGVAGTAYFWAAPYSAFREAILATTGTQLTDLKLRPTANGNVVTEWAGTSSNPTVIRWWVPPADWFIGACALEWNYGGTGGSAGAYWLPIVGEDIPAGDFSTTPAPWFRISNGAVRLTHDPNSTLLECEWWNGTTWVAFDFIMDFWTGSAFPGVPRQAVRWHRPRVLRVCPEFVSIRVLVEVSIPGANYAMPVYVDASIRRGQRHIDLSFSHPLNITGTVRLGVNPAATAVQVTAPGQVGIAANAAVSGVKWVIGSTVAYTADLANGKINTNTATTGSRFMIGAEILGIDTNIAAVDQVRQWLYHTSERVAVVGR